MCRVTGNPGHGFFRDLLILEGFLFALYQKVLKNEFFHVLIFAILQNLGGMMNSVSFFYLT